MDLKRHGSGRYFSLMKEPTTIKQQQHLLTIIPTRLYHWRQTCEVFDDVTATLSLITLKRDIVQHSL
ncbi:hypothetical protein MTR_4g129207 [Medicago truncatula]|uniref:Uncharacterized protein n=1 Tax=Medicago truncatula TaxID=3880 RepID=A0A072UTA0_MEDTR|nr:hypothetical protein MTR_4g129207 [Medicago truncatula]